MKVSPSVKRIAKLRETSGILKQYADMAREALCQKESEFLIAHRQRERIFLCPPVPAAAGEDEAEILAYEYAGSHKDPARSVLSVSVFCFFIPVSLCY